MQDKLYVDIFEIGFYYREEGDYSICFVASYQRHKHIDDNPIIRTDSLDSKLLKELFT